MNDSFLLILTNGRKFPKHKRTTHLIAVVCLTRIETAPLRLFYDTLGFPFSVPKVDLPEVRLINLYLYIYIKMYLR